MSKKIFIPFSENFKLLDYGKDHVMRGNRYEKAIKEFKKYGLDKFISFEKVKEYDEKILELFHTKEYINKVKNLNEDGYGFISMDTPAFKGIYDVSKLSVFATLSAIDISLDNNISFNLCGGWHHAFSDTGRGFCVFNDIVIGAKYAQKKGIKKILILDYDAHHGDGTQIAFKNDKNVFTLSFHQDPDTLYPYMTGRLTDKAYSNLNIPMPPLSNDESFMFAFKEILPLIFEKIKPELLIVQTGVDGHCDCVVANLSFSYKSYFENGTILSELIKKYKTKIVFLGGGGFVHPMLGEAWASVISGILSKNFNLPIDKNYSYCLKTSNDTLYEVKDIIISAKNYIN